MVLYLYFVKLLILKYSILKATVRLTITFRIGLLPAKFCPDFHFPSIARHERRKFLVSCLIVEGKRK